MSSLETRQPETGDQVVRPTRPTRDERFLRVVIVVVTLPVLGLSITCWLLASRAVSGSWGEALAPTAAALVGAVGIVPLTRIERRWATARRGALWSSMIVTVLGAAAGAGSAGHSRHGARRVASPAR
ncbi:MAG TPA: hypothetical protein VFK13_08530 [Gemmatimonadaceae bacterium]|nr:hypothetical protein [Gemmatimonadaceae bacterium]